MSKPDKRVGGGAVTAAPKRSGPPKGGPKHDKSGGKNRDGGSKRDGGGGKAATASGGKGKPAAPPPAAPPATRKERKQLSEQRKLATKKHYGTIAETVRLWEAARPRANSAEQRAKLADDVARRFLGKAQDLATHHSASRVLQFALRELPAGSKLRTSLVAEVRTAAVPLARSKYGKHVVQRLIAHAARGGGGSADGKAELDGELIEGDRSRALCCIFFVRPLFIARAINFCRGCTLTIILRYLSEPGRGSVSSRRRKTFFCP